MSFRDSSNSTNPFTRAVNKIQVNTQASTSYTTTITIMDMQGTPLGSEDQGHTGMKVR